MRCLAASSQSIARTRREHIEARLRAVLDEVYVLGAAHVLAEFLSARGNCHASDDEIREIAARVDSCGGAH